MANKRLAALLTAVAVSSVVPSESSAQTAGPNLKQHQRQRMNRGIDDGIAKRAPQIGDEHIARKAPQNIDDGIFLLGNATTRFFKPGRVAKTNSRIAKPNIR